MTDATPDETTATTPGALLAAERERRGLSRADVAQRLHMSVSQVEALEGADYGRLPRGPFLRGFTRNYARLLGLDAERLVGMVAGEAPQEAAPGIVVPSQNIRFDPLGSRLANPYVKAAGIAAAVIVLGFAAMYWWLFIRPHGVGGSAARKPVADAQTVEIPQPAVVPSSSLPAEPAASSPEAPPAPAGEPPASTPSPATAPGDARPAAPSSSPPPGPTPATVAGASSLGGDAARPAATVADKPGVASGPGAIHLAFRGPAWVEIVDGRGRTLLSRTHAAGASADVAGSPPYSVVIGNAAGVTLTYEGREFDLSPHTREAVARFTLK